MSQKLQFIKKKDLWIISGLLAAAFFMLAVLMPGSAKNAGCYAEIYYDGKLAATAYLDEPRIFSIDGLPQVVFEVKDGAIAFIRSDCPDRICVNTGRLDRAGQLAACLPNRVSLRITGGHDDGGVDVVAR